MSLQNLGSTDEEILRFVLEVREARYTDLRNYLERNNVCNEKTFVSHKKQLEVAGLLQKKLSEKTKRPVYVIPARIKKRLNMYFEREKTKRSVVQWVDSAEYQKVTQALELLSNPKVWKWLEKRAEGKAQKIVLAEEVMDLLYSYCEKYHERPEEVAKNAIKQYISNKTVLQRK